MWDQPVPFDKAYIDSRHDGLHVLIPPARPLGMQIYQGENHRAKKYEEEKYMPKRMTAKLA